MNAKFFFGAMLLLSLSCGEPGSEKSVQINIEILDDEGAPVSGAKVQTDNVDVGFSDANGKVTTRVIGDEGQLVSISIVCPDGFEPLLETRQKLPLRFLSQLGKPSSLSPLDVRFVCFEKIREHVLVVRTDNRPNIPIKIMGREVTSTDDDGVALFQIEGEQGEEILVTLDTEAQPELRPASPYRRLLLPSQSRFLVFDQKFEEKKKKKRKKRKKVKAQGPMRL